MRAGVKHRGPVCLCRQSPKFLISEVVGHFDFAHPIIAKAQNPFSFAHTVDTIARLVDHHRFEVVHAHLTYDHWLAQFATRGKRTAIVRTFHSRRVLRGDVVTRWLIAHTEGICVVNDSNFAGLGLNGEGYTSFSIATPTGEGLTTARTFCRERRMALCGGGLSRS